MIDRSIKVLTKSQLYQDFCYSHLEYRILRDILILTNPPLSLNAAALKHREQFNQGGEVLNQDRSGKNKVVIWTLLSGMYYLNSIYKQLREHPSIPPSCSLFTPRIIIFTFLMTSDL